MFSYLMSRADYLTYCAASVLRRTAPRRGAYWRLHASRAARQPARLDRHMPAAEWISFADAIFFPNRGWLESFAVHYRREVGLLRVQPPGGLWMPRSPISSSRWDAVPSGSERKPGIREDLTGA
jgi:hypothetical protein